MTITTGNSTAIRMEIRVITPEEAEKILNQAGANRPIKRKKVELFARDMANGEWYQTGETIAFDTRGKLIQGQHRMSAVVKSGVPIEFCVVYNVKTETQDSMDSGASRSLSDQLSMRGEKNTTGLAAAITLSKNWQTHGYPRGDRTTNIQSSIRFFQENQGLRDSVNFVCNKAKKISYPTGLASAIHYRMKSLSEDDANQFWEVLCSMNAPANTEAIVLLRNTLLQKAAIKSSRLEPLHRAAITVQSWNSWVTGTDRRLYRWSPHRNEAFPSLIDPFAI